MSRLTGCYMSGMGDAARHSVSVKYDAIVTPVSKAVTNTGIAAVASAAPAGTSSSAPEMLPSPTSP